MTIITSWNINSVRKREPLILEMISEHNPDIICLQEIKCVQEQFPQCFSDLGYNAVVNGQKSYNGVAVLSRFKTELLGCAMEGYAYEEARFLKVFTGDCVVYNVYVTNGQSVSSPAYFKQVSFFENLIADVKKSIDDKCNVVVCGDFNVAPKDCHADFALRSSFICDDVLRRLWFDLIALGLHDSFSDEYTWWDYRYRGLGARIDCILSNRKLKDAHVLKKYRFQVDSPSDHTCLLGVI